MKKQALPTLVGLFILLTLGWYIDHMAHQELTTAIKLIIYAIVATIITTLIVIIIFAILIVRERVLKERASRESQGT